MEGSEMRVNLKPEGWGEGIAFMYFEFSTALGRLPCIADQGIAK